MLSFSQSLNALTFYSTKVLLSSLNSFSIPLQNDSINSIITCFLWFWLILTDLSKPSMMNDFLLSTFDSWMVVFFAVDNVCLSKHRLFYRQIEKSRLFNWELAFNGVVFLKDDAFRRLLTEEIFFVSLRESISYALRIWFFLL